MRHESTSAANSATPRKRIDRAAPALAACARSRGSQDANTSQVAASADAMWRASKFPKPSEINSLTLDRRPGASVPHGDSASHRSTRAARHGIGFLMFSSRSAADRTNLSDSDSAAIRASTASDSSRIRTWDWSSNGRLRQHMSRSTRMLPVYPTPASSGPLMPRQAVGGWPKDPSPAKPRTRVRGLRVVGRDRQGIREYP
jgi:hypothetical protein